MSISWENTGTTIITATANNNETQEFSADPAINKKVKIAVSGLPKYVQKYFINDIIRDKDKELAANFIISCVNQESCKQSTKRIYVLALAYLCRFLTHNKKTDVSLDQVTADMLYDYITNFRPAEEGEATANNNETQEFSADPVINKKVKIAVKVHE